jgi:hypothetical protein
MYPHCRRRKGRLDVTLRRNRKVGQQTVTDHFGVLGSVYGEPIKGLEGVKFHVGLDVRFRVIRERWPGRISEADEAKVRDQIAARIPLPSTEAEKRLALMLKIHADAMTALDQADDADAGEAAMAEAARQLARLTRRGVTPMTEDRSEA